MKHLKAVGTTNEWRRMSQFQVPLAGESGGRDALPMQIMQLHAGCMYIYSATDGCEDKSWRYL